MHSTHSNVSIFMTKELISHGIKVFNLGKEWHSLLYVIIMYLIIFSV